MVNTNIIVGPNYLGHITADVIMDRIASVVHSNNFIPANKGLQINIAAIKNIKGLKYGINSNIWDDLHRKGSIIVIKNVNDVLCLPRAIAVGIAYAEYQNDKLNNDLEKRFHMTKKNDHGDGCRCTFSLQKCTALEYKNKIGIPYYTPGILGHIPLYEKSLQVGITVISASSGNKRVYKGNSSYKLQVTLYHISDEDTSHFAVITHINALISRAYYCDDCDKGFNNRNYHRCTVWCNICRRNGCILNKNDTVQCIECNAPCHSMSCLNEHRAQKNGNKSLCEKSFFCPYCKVKLHNYKINGIDLDKHTCGESFCKNCQVMYHNDEEENFHKCFMRSILASKSNASNCRFIFYDFKSMVTISGNHVPNFVVVQSLCENCSNVTRVKPNSKFKVCSN